MYPDTCQAGVDDDDYYIPELGNVSHMTMKIVVICMMLDCFCTGGEWLLRSYYREIYICTYVNYDILSKYTPFGSRVSSLGILGVIFKNDKLGTP